MRSYLTTALLVLVLTCTGSAHAGVWVEGAGGSGDAGPLPGTAQTIIGDFLVGTGGLTAIEGRLITTPFPAGADMYRFVITTPTLFSANTLFDPVIVGGTPIGDTQLFLFHLSGHGIAANDDAPSSVRSLLAAGNSLYASLAPGQYLLAVSAFDRDPESVGGAIFPDTPFGAIHGPTGPGGGSPVTTWGGTAFEPGTYRIELTGVAAVPEPSSLVLAGVAAAGGLFARLRRRIAA
jgi:hypothetical protein